MTMMISLESSGMVFDAHHFDDLFDLYLADCTLAGVIPKTIESYTHQLRPFRVWWAARGPALQWQLSRPAMQEFGTWFRQEYTTQKGIPPAQNTLRSGCRRVRQFFNWLYRTGRIPVQVSYPPLKGVGFKRKKTLNFSGAECLTALLMSALLPSQPASIPAAPAVLSFFLV